MQGANQTVQKLSRTQRQTTKVKHRASATRYPLDIEERASQVSSSNQSTANLKEEEGRGG